MNLFLRILNKRPDGYHELASLFQAVNLCDILTFEHATCDSFSCSESIPGNLVLKALHLFREATGLAFPLRIHLEKHIPMEAGLGGGSSNAATTLYALNQLAKKPLSMEQLAAIGLKIGSDVPFFFSSGTAYCTGRGEIFQNISLEPSLYTLCKPSFGSSTAAVFKALQLSTCSTTPPESLLEQFKNNQPHFQNDLETAAFTVNPDLKEFKRGLLEGGYQPLMMSGTGSTFICKSKGTISGEHFEKSVKSINREADGWYL